MTKKQFETRRDRLGALRSKSQRIQSVAAFNLISQRTMEQALENEGTQVLDEASRQLTEDNIAETLWLFSPTLSCHALKWCLTDETWKNMWLDLVGNTIVVHDYAFAHSVSTIQLDRSVRIFHRVEEIEKVAQRLGVELPGPIPLEFVNSYTERNLVLLHHPHLEDNDDLESKAIFIVENEAADIWHQVMLKAANDEHFDEEQVRDVDKIRSLAKDMLWEADTDGDGSISFKEMMLTVTLVHENETDMVLKGEDTELLQEKLTYLDPWMKASTGPSSSVVETTKEEERTTMSKHTFEEPRLPTPPDVSDAPSTPKKQNRDPKTEQKGWD